MNGNDELGLERRLVDALYKVILDAPDAAHVLGCFVAQQAAVGMELQARFLLGTSLSAQRMSSFAVSLMALGCLQQALAAAPEASWAAQRRDVLRRYVESFSAILDGVTRLSAADAERYVENALADAQKTYGTSKNDVGRA
jgi:hypothetical protein